MRVAYLPLDSRPCNAKFPVSLLQAAGIPCQTPNPQDMDCYTQPSNHARIRAFLSQAAQQADVLLISTDQLVYGSLLASRADTLPEPEALARLSLLTTLKAEHPALRIVAFSVVMRASISTLKAADLVHYDAFTAYSQAAHRAQETGDTSQADQIRAQIPADLLAHYHRVRKRNHAVNRACISLAAQGALETLLLLQEDAQPYGFHRMEQQALQQDITRLNCARQVTLHNGTDEGGCLCAAKIAGNPLRLHVRAIGNADLSFVAKYEDRPFRANIESHCAFAGISLVPRDEAEAILYVLTPTDAGQTDVPRPEAIPPSTRATLALGVAELADALRGNLPVALLDVCYANGGALPFMEALAHHISPLRLAGYAAWNTASNALGTVLAQLALARDSQQNTRFTAERLLDDLLYESDIRFRLRDALEAMGEDPLGLRDKPQADHILGDLMREAAHQSPVFAGTNITADYALPWPRTFEIDVTVHSIDQE